MNLHLDPIVIYVYATGIGTGLFYIGAILTQIKNDLKSGKEKDTDQDKRLDKHDVQISRAALRIHDLDGKGDLGSKGEFGE